MPDENKILEDILNGRIRFQRFTRTEQGGSSDAADRFLWLALLRAELELGSADGGGMCPGKGLSPCGTFSPNRFLETLSQELPDTFGKLERQAGAFKDRGQESVVFDGGDGFVYKLRRMRPSILSGYIAPFANIVYHNALFPQDRYVLENVYRGAGGYFMMLRQPRVEILLDGDGYPVRPSAGQLFDAVARLGVGLKMYVHDRASADEEEGDDDGDSSSTDSDPGSGEHLKFYNGDYYVSDLQPGRNTVIDADTGKVRFIDPRITLNDPNGPITPVSRYGCRCEAVSPMRPADWR